MVRAVLLASALAVLSVGGVSARATRTPQPAAGQAPPGTRLGVIMTVYRADGTSPSLMATMLEGTYTRFYYQRSTLCDSAPRGTDYSVMPNDAGFGWRVDVTPLSRSASELIVHMDWQRMWDHGETLVDGPKGSVQLTLHQGDRLPLDTISAAPMAGGCSGVAMALEVSFVGAASSGVLGAVGGRGGAGPNASGVVRGSAAGAGAAGAGAGAGSAVLPLTPKSFTGAGVTGSLSVTSGFDPQTLKVVDAELWLVHTLPNGVEEVQYQLVRTSPGGGDYAFQPVRITTPQDDYSVRITGSVQAQRLAGGGEKVFLGIVRSVTNPNGDPRMRGGSAKTLDMPKPDEVLSFAIPGGLYSTDVKAPLQQPAGQQELVKSVIARLEALRWETFDGHKLSVRLRINR